MQCVLSFTHSPARSLARLRVCVFLADSVVDTLAPWVSDRSTRRVGDPRPGPADRLPPAGDGGVACPRGGTEGVRKKQQEHVHLAATGLKIE